MEQRAVLTDVCREKHKSIDDKFDNVERRLEGHSETLKDHSDFTATQKQINEQILEQLRQLQEWKKEQERKLPRRVEAMIDQIIRWATLGLLALIAAK